MPFAKSIRMAVTGVSLGALFCTSAAVAVDLSVGGSIAPAGCDIALSESTLTMGRVTLPGLASGYANNELEPQKVQVQIDCDAPVRFALSAVDNAIGTASDASPTSFGLGQSDSGASIGYFSMRFDPASLMADRRPIIGLMSTDKASWSATASSQHAGGAVRGPSIAKGASYVAFAEPGTVSVKTIEHFSGVLEVRTFIAPSKNPGDEIRFAGSATLEVSYL
jgi:hypothetical protein